MQKTEANARDSYKLYREVSETPIDCRTYLLIGEGFREFMMSKVIEGEEVMLPARLGTIAIVGTKRILKYTAQGVPILPPNWGKTKALWNKNPEAKLTKKIVFCTNEETGGVVYKLHWSKNKVPIENKKVYSFRLVRTQKRIINQSIVAGKEYLIKNIN